MPGPDDEQFKSYLKQFRPVAPQALPVATLPRTRRLWRISAFAAAAAIIVVVIFVARNHSRQTITNAVESGKSPVHITAEVPFTMRNANKLLADAPSFKSAVNDLAFKSQEIPLAKNEQSAVHVLGKEKVRL